MHYRRYLTAASATAVLMITVGSVAAQDLGTDAQREAGKALYEQKCSQCHGVNGDANSVGLKYFKPAPRDFTAAIFKFRSTPNGELPTSADIVRSIRNGMPYTGMPAWPNLSDSEVDNLVYYIKSFSDDFSGPYGTPESITIPKPPRITDESIARGRDVYLENQCSDCHGDQGRGDGSSAPTLEDQWSKHIRPADLTKRWTFRGGSTREDIYRTFTTGLDGSPMPAYEIDPPEDQWNLVNYVYSLSRDESDYATAIVSSTVSGPIDVNAGVDQFATATPALIPLVGQVIEPGRSFFPGVNSVEVRAIHNADDIAFLLSWNDMGAETNGANSPAATMPEKDLSDAPSEAASNTDEFGGVLVPAEDSVGTVSDAVAIQFPAETPDGSALPYLMFGDSKRPVHVWFADLANPGPKQFIGSGSESLTEIDASFEVSSSFEAGQWNVVLKRSRVTEDGIGFAEQQFIPIAFSVWDGFHGEVGNKRGMSSWYYVFVEPLERESALVPMARSGLLTLLVGLGIVFIVKRRYRGRDVAELAAA